MDNLSPGYEFIKNNMQGSITRTVLEDTLRSRYNVQSGAQGGRTISDPALFVSSLKTGRGGGRSSGHGGNSEANRIAGAGARGV